MFYRMDIYWFIFVLPAVLFAGYAQSKINSEYNKYSRISNETGYTGEQIARMILNKHGMSHVRIERVSGKLSDHYDPRTKVVRLSSGIYSGTSIAAMGVAAHEVGHAIQHEEEYYPLKIRSAIAPIVGIGNRFVWIFIAIGMIFAQTKLGIFMEIGIALFIGVVLFQIVTLPVEIDASRRALLELEDGIAPSKTVKGSKKVLQAAALTYVAATLTAIGNLLRILAVTKDSRDRR